MGHEARRGQWGWALHPKRKLLKSRLYLLNVLFINNSVTAMTPLHSLYTAMNAILCQGPRVKQTLLVPTDSARSTTESKALRGTFRQETKLPGWFVGSEQQSCHWATVNLSQSAPLLSWFIEGVNNRNGLGTSCKAQNLNFLCSCTPLCLQSFVSSPGELRFWLSEQRAGREPQCFICTG